ncbi:MAG: response regulator transcription factor [Bacteroidetes bacterium]|nr:response regulator transcription factor [Bacteroidota bacterium]MBU1679118.1 response regulator transcription factor [Bacteroidota bacterium]MBU2506999.1 response regulator transcription factor [Bacteroidota bacterium]
MITNTKYSGVISIAIIEDIDDIRIPMREFLSSCAEFLCDIDASSVEEFLEKYRDDVQLDVILLDIGLPGISGLGAIQLIKERIPNCLILMSTIHDEAEKIFQALKSGASGYLLKDTPLADVKNAIVEVYEGGAPMSPPIARKVINYFNKNETKITAANITTKEKEIIAQMVDGMSLKMIAANLGNSVETIKYHTKNIYKKLHVNSKTEVVAKSLRGEI